ncbi:MAG: Asp-tRNA(Asn)/Glu-tRNA(Gln) amidotransferase subunit GatC [Terriglobales bacterium]
MNMPLDDIAALAALELGPEETASLQRDLEAILDYVAQLQRVKTEGVEAMAHLGALLQPDGPAADEPAALRPDAVRASLPAEAALANAPAQASGMFAVPKIVERG